jgi:predicted metalloprotease with PDZ domain
LSRYVATVILAHLGLLSPDDVRDAVAGELSVVATSPHRALGPEELSRLAPHDETARATLAARTALWALAESAAMRGRSKGATGLLDTLRAAIGQVEDNKAPVTQLSWLMMISTTDPGATKTWDAFLAQPGPVSLPPGALGPCFRAGTGEYVAYDPGFDVEATRISTDGRVTGVRAGGPAEKAGLRGGDLVSSMQARDGDPDVPIKVVATRGGTKVEVTFSPRGTSGRGQTWTRVKGIPDDKCGEPP